MGTRQSQNGRAYTRAAAGKSIGTSAAGPVLSALTPIGRPQQAQGAARETTGTSAARAVLSALPLSGAPEAAREAAEASAARAVTFNARRDYELLEQVVSTYGR